MPILTIFLVIAVFVLVAWLAQRFLQEPIKTIVLVFIGIVLLVWLFSALGLWSVRV